MKKLDVFSPDIPKDMIGSPTDWMRLSRVIDSYKTGTNYVQKTAAWLSTRGTLLDFVKKISNRYCYLTYESVLLFFDWGHARISEYDFKIEMYIYGVEEEVDKFLALVDQHYTRTQCMIEWNYSTANGPGEVSIPLTYKETYNEFYPWIKLPLNEYFDNYMKSESTVMVLIGPPGTGKTSFIRSMLHHTKSDAMVTYDADMMNGDALFTKFISGTSDFLISEDADEFLSARRDGNKIMSKFLNVSDGLVSCQHKKIVFSTNLPSIQSIDPALLRAGRCYDIVHFRDLSYDEAKAACKLIGKEPAGMEKDKRYFLTDLFNAPIIVSGTQQKMGF